MGGGRVGLKLASLLSQEGHDITLIENDQKICEKAASNIDAMVIYGNGTDSKILNEANINNADVFVAATGTDETNLMACIMVHEYQNTKLIARIQNPLLENTFKKIGVDSVVSPELTAASYLEKLIIKEKIADLVILGKGKAELINISIKNSEIIGKTVGELSPNADYIICALYKDKNSEITIPQSDMVLEEGFKVSILTKKEAVKKVIKIFI